MERKRVMESAIVCKTGRESERELLMSITASGAVSARFLANGSSIGTHTFMSVGPTHLPN